MSVTKSIKIKTGTSTYDARDIGAEAQYIDVSRDSSNDIIEDITEPGVTVVSTEGLASTLKNIEANKQDKLPAYDTAPTQNSTNLVTSGGVYTAIQADSALSPTSIKPVQNKVVSNALDNKLNKNNVSTVEAINGTAVGNYEPGDIFVANNGNTYAATATITGGTTTIAVGTNCALKTISQTFQRVDDNVDSVKQALSDEVNFYGSKNLLNFVGSKTWTSTNTNNEIIGKIFLKAGTKIVYSCYQETALSSCTRNTLQIQKVGSSDSSYESSSTNYHLTAGTHSMNYTVPSDGEYKFMYWCHQPSANATYSQFMVCSKTIWDFDPTYVEPALPNSQLLSYKDNGVLGAKNLLPLATNTLLKYGVTKTYNSDGTFTLNTDANGATAPANIPLDFIDSTKLFDVTKLIGKSVIGSILDTAISGVSVKFGYFKANGTYVDEIIDTTTRVEFTYPSDAVYGRSYLTVDTGTVLSNVKVYPMIRLASDTDPTYQPYAMTNKQLTDGKAEKSDLASISITGTTNSTGATINSRTFFYLNGELVIAKTDIANGAALTSGTNYEAVTAGGLNNLINKKAAFSILSDADYAYSATSNATHTFATRKSTVQLLVIAPWADANSGGLYLVLTTVNGTVNITPIKESSIATITTGSSSISVAISSTATGVYLLSL